MGWFDWLFKPFDYADQAVYGTPQSAKTQNAMKAEARAAMPVFTPQITTIPVVNEAPLQVARQSNPDSIDPGALAGGGNAGLQLQPLGLRGLGGIQRSTILGG